MSSGLTTTIQTMLLNHVFSTPYTSPPTEWYIALYTVSPGPEGGGTEVSEASYERAQCTVWNGATFESPSVVTNAEEIVFPEALTAWGDIVAFAVFDEWDNMLVYGPCVKTIGVGDIARFPEDAIEIMLDHS